MADSSLRQQKVMPAQEIVKVLDYLRPQLDALKARYEGDDAQLILLRDEVKALLRAHGLMFKEHINSKWMGTHSVNRFGDGVVPSDVLALIGDIYGQGFSLQALMDPTCIEMPPANTKQHAAFWQFNVDMTVNSSGMLAAYTDEIKFLSVTCGHTSQGFRCFQNSIPWTDPDDTRFTEDGLLSCRVLQKTQPVYADAVENGIKWDVVRHQVADAHPWICQLFQEAGNATQQITHGENRVQMLLKIAYTSRHSTSPYGVPERPSNWKPSTVLGAPPEDTTRNTCPVTKPKNEIDANIDAKKQRGH